MFIMIIFYYSTTFHPINSIIISESFGIMSEMFVKKSESFGKRSGLLLQNRQRNRNENESKIAKAPATATQNYIAGALALCGPPEIT